MMVGTTATSAARTFSGSGGIQSVRTVPDQRPGGKKTVLQENGRFENRSGLPEIAKR
jgi:hypothetical protein